MIPKADLEHGAYYVGRCRNATVARWDGKSQRFRHWREKFGQHFMEYIKHPDDDQIFDVFVAERKLDHHATKRLIPLGDDEP